MHDAVITCGPSQRRGAHETPRVHHAARRRYGMAAGGARAAVWTALTSGHVWLIRVFAGRLDNRRPTVDLACESPLRGCRRSPIGGHRLGADLAEALHQIGII